MFRVVFLTALVGVITIAGGTSGSKGAPSRPTTALSYTAAKCVFDDAKTGMPAAAAQTDCLNSIRMSAPYPTYSGVKLERALELEARCIESRGLERCRPVRGG